MSSISARTIDRTVSLTSLLGAGPENLFVPCISEAVPDVVRLSLDNSTPSHVRRAALRLSQGLWSETGPYHLPLYFGLS